MDELKTATLAFRVSAELVRIDRKILAIALVRLMYDANLQDAKSFVDNVQVQLNRMD